FRAGHRLDVIRVVALQTPDEGDAEARGEEGVFAVSFLAAAPARVAEDVDVRRPKREAEVLRAVAVVFGAVIIVFRARLGGDDVGFLMHERRVPGRRHADGLRKHRRDAPASDMRLTRSFTRVAIGCVASFQITGPGTTGCFNAAVSSALIMSAARTKMMDCPESSLSSNELNFAVSVRPMNVNVSGPPIA